MTIDHRKVVALATNETPFVKRVDDIDDYQVTTTVTRYTKSVWLADKFKAASLDLNFAVNKSLVDSVTYKNLVTFTRASSGTYVGADGLIKTAPVNLLKYSNTFTNSNWTKSGLTLVSSTATAPDGTATATTFSATTGFIFQNGGSVIGQPYVNCIWIKGNANATIGLRRPGNSDSIIGNGSVALNVTTEWQKFTAVQASANNTEGRLLIDLRSSSGATVPAGFEISLWHAQTQEGTTPTEYIPTGATISGAPRFDHINTTPVNILLYSEQMDQWIVGSGSSVTANQAVAPDGTNTADRVQHGGGGSSWIRQDILTPGTTYTASVYAKAVTPGTNDRFTIDLGSFPILGDFVATDEWQRFSFTFTAANNSFYLNNGDDSFATDVYFWGAQVEEGSVATDYIPTTNTRAAAAVPTFESLGLLIEEARTNVITYSEQVNLWSLFNGTASSNVTTSPAGDQTADKWIPDTTNNFHHATLVGQPNTSSSITYSVYAKAAGYRYMLINTVNGSASGNAGPIVDLQDGVVVGNLTATYPTVVTNVGNDWYRIAMTFTGNAGQVRVDHNPLPTSALAAYTGDGTSGVFLWGSQLEAGAFVTSYIPTTSSQVTRAADIAEITGTNFSNFFNQSEGTFFGDITGSGGFGFVAHDGSNNNRHGFGPTQGQSFTIISGVSTNFGIPPTPVVGGGKVAHAYKANDYGAFGNGANLPATSPTTVPIGVNELALGYRGSFLANAFLNGHIKRLSYFPTRLANEILQSITS